MVYSIAPSTTSDNTDIRVRFSSDDGGSWSGTQKVNTDRTKNSQFLPRIAVDQTSGRVGMSWYDARNDKGSGSGSTNRVVNDDTQMLAVVGRPSGTGFVV